MSRCEISCGQCCDKWREVESLVELATSTAWTKDRCPHEGVSGCILARRDRPEECVIYLCDISLKVKRHELRLCDGLRIKEVE
jgi:hypothetical protein